MAKLSKTHLLDRILNRAAELVRMPNDELSVEPETQKARVWHAVNQLVCNPRMTREMLQGVEEMIDALDAAWATIEGEAGEERA